MKSEDTGFRDVKLHHVENLNSNFTLHNGRALKEILVNGKLKSLQIFWCRPTNVEILPYFVVVCFLGERHSRLLFVVFWVKDIHDCCWLCSGWKTFLIVVCVLDSRLFVYIVISIQRKNEFSFSLIKHFIKKWESTDKLWNIFIFKNAWK